ncbi:MAG TPA: hypothetical protein P5157_04450 [Paludibacteraceae bacterium]|jgi:hypothetical protein|nr:hypothetical protein [Paludibacteraceae bacterium]OPZ02781.1 MAG: hypothetical protein BWZ11_00632 [Bacteroidetes bacterium ADurb.BinA395]MBP8965932.1 hypothetical protein [Paludibacteraceae bacterium]HOF99413.1 hypothetical protein [Paludibacteraceae bacterium]HOJ66246.1 hypothetical protein [Paludibacteraceae bacterium]
MFYTLLITLLIVLLSVLLLGFRIFFIKSGKFPNIHIGGSKALQQRGIGCATTQDKEAQRNFHKGIDVSNLLTEISEQLKNE